MLNLQVNNHYGKKAEIEQQFSDGLISKDEYNHMIQTVELSDLVNGVTLENEEN